IGDDSLIQCMDASETVSIDPSVSLDDDKSSQAASIPSSLSSMSTTDLSSKNQS
ncbi:unnamed protein product, partial [Didymodactylos carnosus]